MRDSRRIQERTEMRLDSKAVVWLTIGGLVTIALAFAFGSVVGARTARLSAPSCEPASPVADAAPEPNTASGNEMTFYAKLKEKSRAPAKPEAVRPSKPDPASSTASPAHNASATPKPRSPASENTEAGRSLADALHTAKTVDVSNVDEEIKAALADGPASSGEFTIQVSAFRTEAEAQAYSTNLERKGLEPFVVKANVGKRGTWYRVRLGRFVSESDARRAKGVLLASDIPGWVLKAE